MLMYGITLLLIHNQAQISVNGFELHVSDTSDT